MKLFSELFHDLDQLTKTNDRLDRLVLYFEKADPVDSIWVCWFLAGNRIKGGVRTGELRSFVAQRSGLPEWLVRECHDQVGDLAETLSLLVEAESKGLDISLNEVVAELIKPMISMSTIERKVCLNRAWDLLRQVDLLPFHKLLTGGFRMGVSKGNLYKALARVGKVETAVIAQRLAGDWTPARLDLNEILNPAEEDDAFCRPFPFCLASPMQEESPDSLGPTGEWQVEWKWDGIRAQLIKRSGSVMLWSRGDESVGEAFPDLLDAAKMLPPDICLDGEILAWGKEGLRSFSRLQRRLGRKTPNASIIRREPVRFQAYDLLRLEGEDLRTVSLERRRGRMEKALASLPQSYPVGLSPVVEETDWKTLAALRQESRARGVEGFMLKRKSSPYEGGRVRGSWYKWKIDPYTAEMVVVSAQLGHGKRSNLYSDYSLAVLNEKEDLVVVAKAYSGLTDREVEEVDRYVRKNITGKFGPIRAVRPGLVFEVAFEGAQFSSRHKSGVALRFPRIKRWRKDKKPEQADTLELIRGLAGEGKAPEKGGPKTDEDGNLLLF